ncbi:leucine-rich repeat domain-containing protein [[Clostridium] polysaccharolyticum]|jgi:hypothetical protein|uniref:Leucine rich repeat-containing protein n=1 Tax=[Clostridium] polysaccharolyticum TaxID=29364 RepID=A0A1I0DN11_9FIRM|nr:leucine-rich repeat domain-containing protein [[Clostridium] polysaccharolyticum]SET33083.1 Leucine rich repeat-containing protein [[Clostridium] polysaccharolyticum]
MDFSYTVCEKGIEITKYLKDEAVAEVPAEIDGKAVISIGKYAFEGKRELIEVVLPDGMVTIGAHAFYNCRKLTKIHLSDCIISTEDGAFKNCRSLRYVFVKVILYKMTFLKNLLSELNQEIHVTMDYEKEGQTSKLVFPSYLHDYVDNVEARIINQVTYGSGVHYRECMQEKSVDFNKYDKTFYIAKINDSEDTLLAIVLYRLEYPYELSMDARNEYKAYIKEHFLQIIELCVEKEDVDALMILAKHGFYTEDSIDSAIQVAHRREKIACTGVLLDYKKSHFSVRKKTFDL